MKDVVEKILMEEERASKILLDAKAESERIVKDAKKEKEDMINQSIYKTETSSQARIEESERRFISEKENVLKEVQREALGIREKNEKEIPEIAKKVFSQVITIKG